jgi:hypothetical protein
MHLSNEKISLLCRPDGEVLGQLRTFRGENAYIIPDDIGIDDYKRVVIQLESYMKLRGIECTDKEDSQQAAGNGPQVIQASSFH